MSRTDNTVWLNFEEFFYLRSDFWTKMLKRIDTILLVVLQVSS